MRALTVVCVCVCLCLALTTGYHRWGRAHWGQRYYQRFTCSIPHDLLLYFWFLTQHHREIQMIKLTDTQKETQQGKCRWRSEYSDRGYGLRATGYGLRAGGWSAVRILAQAKTLVFSANRRNRSWGTPSLHPICTGVF